RVDLRTEMGRLSRPDFSRRRRDRNSEPRCETSESLFSGSGGCLAGAAAGAVRTGWGDRDRVGGRFGFRLAAAAAASGGVAGEAADQTDSGVGGVLPFAGGGRSRSSRRAIRIAAEEAAENAGGSGAAGPCDSGDARCEC